MSQGGVVIHLRRQHAVTALGAREGKYIDVDSGGQLRHDDTSQSGVIIHLRAAAASRQCVQRGDASGSRGIGMRAMQLEARGMSPVGPAHHEVFVDDV
eukprot:scaffold316152_cov30-Tisochrysis_lutea.AAC.1